MKKLLNKYTGLSDQAENIDSYESYKELIDTIRGLTYSEMHGMMRDCETILEVLVRGETNCNLTGIDILVGNIVELGEHYLKHRKLKPRYTYEYIEQQNRDSCG